MAKYKIGSTDYGDAGINLSWIDKIPNVDGAVLITKEITKYFMKTAVLLSDKLIVHSTITGYGHSKLEPNVPVPERQFQMTMMLVDSGFPIEKVVIRVDPIIPTAKGIEIALGVMRRGIELGFKRFRISLIDMYPHVRKRLEIDTNGKLNLYHGKFSPSRKQCRAVDMAISEFQSRKDIRIESCAEPNLHNTIQCGCISEYDLKLLGLNDPEFSDAGYQRRNCMCYAGKVELITDRIPCQHGCLYCFLEA